MTKILNMLLRMELLSDALPGSGEGLASIIDTDVCFDELGLPFVPGKRVKGILRESALELNSAGRTIDGLALFGRPDQVEGSQFRLGNGYLEGYQEARQALLAARGDPARSALLNAQSVIGCFTTIRSRTALENGVARDKSLRTMRVLNRGLIFVFEMDVPAEAEKNLETICKVTRSFGESRTRGLGEIRLSVGPRPEPVKAGDSRRLVNESGDLDCCKVSFKLRNRGQLLLAQRAGRGQKSEPHVPGSALLGAFGAWYKQKRDLADPCCNDQEFRELFLDGGVVFSDARPVAGQQTALPCPLSIVREKDGERLFDLLREDDHDTIVEGKIQTKGQPATQVLLVAPTLTPVSVRAEIEYHHRRPVDRGVGRPLEKSTSGGDAGEFFQFEVLAADQEFRGTLTGERRLLGKLMAATGLRLGKSRTAQYGACDLEWGDVTRLDSPGPAGGNTTSVSAGNSFTLTILSDAIVTNQWGFPSAEPADLLREIEAAFKLRPGTLSIETSCVGSAIVGGFVGVWGLPRPQQPVLRAGSALRVKTSQDITDLAAIERRPYGLRTNEGFGAMAVNWHGDVGLSRSRTPPVALGPVKSNALFLEIEFLVASEWVDELFGREARSNARRNPSVTPSFVGRMRQIVAESGGFADLSTAIADFGRKPAGKQYRKIQGALWKCESGSFDNRLRQLVNQDGGLIRLDPSIKTKLGREPQLFESFKRYASAYLSELRLQKRGA